MLLYVQIEETASKMFDAMVHADNIPINYSIPGEPQTMLQYVEMWHMKLWDHAYAGVFKGADAYKKSELFKEHPTWMMAVKRVIYKYIYHDFLVWQFKVDVTL